MTGSRADGAPDPARRRFLRDLALFGIAVGVGGAWWTRRAAPGPAYPWPETARSWRAMGTLIEVRVPDLPPAAAVEAVARVRRTVEELEAAMTLFRPESPLVALNGAPAGRWVPVPTALTGALRAAGEAALTSGGAYDPTVARALRGYGLLPGPVRQAPDRDWRRRGGVEALHVEAERARRLDTATEIDLGGIGKGIAVDEALTDLARVGSGAALVNLGGSIGVLGPPRDAPEGWPVAIAHPDRPGAVWATGRLRRGHLATSGDYERYVDTPRGRVHHILDPRHGEPAPGVASVTVWEASGQDADVASTASFVHLSRGEREPGGAYLALLRTPEGLRETRGGAAPSDAVAFDLEIA